MVMKIKINMKIKIMMMMKIVQVKLHHGKWQQAVYILQGKLYCCGREIGKYWMN